MSDEMQLDAVEVRPGRYAVRPAGQLGTCGWFPRHWTVQWVNAPSAIAAIRKAQKLFAEEKPHESPHHRQANLNR